MDYSSLMNSTPLAGRFTKMMILIGKPSIFGTV